MKFLKLFLSYGLIFGLGMGLYFGLQYGVMYGIFGGLVAGALFGICMAIPLMIRGRVINGLRELAREDVAEHEILLEGHVNTKDGFKVSRDGWLYLTKTKIVFVRKTFKSSPLYRKEIQLTASSEAKTCRVGIYADAFCITCNGQENKFFNYNSGAGKVVKSSIWVEAIQNAIKEIRS